MKSSLATYDSVDTALPEEQRIRAVAKSSIVALVLGAAVCGLVKGHFTPDAAPAQRVVHAQAAPAIGMTVADAEAAAKRDFGVVTVETMEAETTMAKYGVRLAATLSDDFVVDCALMTHDVDEVSSFELEEQGLCHWVSEGGALTWDMWKTACCPMCHAKPERTCGYKRCAGCLHCLDYVECSHPISCDVTGYAGTDGECTCAEGWEGVVSYIHGAPTGCTEIPPTPISCDQEGYTGVAGHCSCADGYAGTVSYMQDSVLTGCTVLDCGTPTVPPGFSVEIPASTTVGSTASVTCAAGYSGDPADMLCLEDGTWSCPLDGGFGTAGACTVDVWEHVGDGTCMSPNEKRLKGLVCWKDSMIDTLDKCKVKCEQYDWCQGVSYMVKKWTCSLQASRDLEEEEKEEIESMNVECEHRGDFERSSIRFKQYEQKVDDMVIDHATLQNTPQVCWKRTSGWV